MRALIFSTALLFSFLARADVLFIDLNNSPKEVEACRAGAQEAYDGDQVITVGPSSGDSGNVTMSKIRAKVQEAQENGVVFDSIVVSGEDGSGHFFGSHGDFFAVQFRDLVKEINRNQGRTQVRTTALWGCYPTSKHGCETFWLKPNKSINMAVGFAVQGPNQNRPVNHQLMREFCRRREEAAEAVTLDQMCLFYKNLDAGKADTSVAVCNREGVASDFYDTVDPSTGKRSGRNVCQSYDELEERCSEFDPGDELKTVFENCLSGQDSNYEANCGDTTKRLSPLRRFYNDLHLWRHCKQRVETERGFELPHPMQVIRLIKFRNIQENLARLNARELAEYDERLETLGLGEYALGDIRTLTRSEMNRKIEGAIASLRGKMRRPVTTGRADQGAVLEMAEGLGRTFVSLDYECTHFTNVSPGSKKASPCILSYAEAGE